jgi:hypothetical protein
MHPSLHSPLVRGYFEQAKAPSDELGGTGALLKCLLRLESGGRLGSLDSHVELVPHYRSGLDPGWVLPRGLPPKGQDGKHLERTGRPKHVGIKLGWRSPF